MQKKKIVVDLYYGLDEKPISKLDILEISSSINYLASLVVIVKTTDQARILVTILRTLLVVQDELTEREKEDANMVFRELLQKKYADNLRTVAIC